MPAVPYTKHCGSYIVNLLQKWIQMHGWWQILRSAFRHSWLPVNIWPARVWHMAVGPYRASRYGMVHVSIRSSPTVMNAVTEPVEQINWRRRLTVCNWKQYSLWRRANWQLAWRSRGSPGRLDARRSLTTANQQITNNITANNQKLPNGYKI